MILGRMWGNFLFSSIKTWPTVNQEFFTCLALFSTEQIFVINISIIAKQHVTNQSIRQVHN